MENSNLTYYLLFGVLLVCLVSCASKKEPELQIRQIENFGKNWSFHLGDIRGAQEPGYDDSNWRSLRLPHDWSIEGEFSKDNPAGAGGGALPGGLGWYRKTFNVAAEDSSSKVFIDFDGVYRNSEVWINGQYLGMRPCGYSSFRYDLTPHLHFGKENTIAVRVDNSQQPNSRWYTGSGIYRNVWLVKTGKMLVDHWGTFITTPEVSSENAQVKVHVKLRNSLLEDRKVNIKTAVLDKSGQLVNEAISEETLIGNAITEIVQELEIKNPDLWSIENPNLYSAITSIEHKKKIVDDYKTDFGIRTISFDSTKGFFLNNKPVKIKGVCNHHDLGCLGAAVNSRAIERQLEIMREMGVNAIRTAHNPPAPELLDLCDQMGFLVMDEAFDMWKKKKSEYDYALYWNEWHAKDLKDLVLRDRNHPSIIVWSIGNEVLEQYDKSDSSGAVIARELAAIVKDLDTTRPVTAACNDQHPDNPVIRSGALDLIGYNYSHNKYADFPDQFQGKKFIATETTSSLATRGHYDMPSDSIRLWPVRWDIPFLDGNPDNTCSSYDNCHTPWGSTHEDVWRVIKQNDFLSGMFIWTGFDYLGEPTPYGWPSRSSYFGIVDLAGFPKDAYYMYQSEWTNNPVLHIFPHWNWQQGDTLDIWAYTNCKEVELFLNDKSLGIKQKNENDFHIQWRVVYSPGILKAVGRTDGQEIITKEIRTAGEASDIIMEADRSTINADGQDLSFIIVKVIDQNGTIVPHADQLISFSLEGEGQIIGVDNGLQTSHESFKSNSRKAFNGKCLAVIQSTEKPGNIKILATSELLQSYTLNISTK